MQHKQNHTRVISYPGNEEKKFWRKAFLIYAIAEALFIIISYFITYYKCKVCVLPLPYYISIFLINLLLALLLLYVLSSFHQKAVCKIITGNILFFFVYYFYITGFLYFLFISCEE